MSITNRKFLGITLLTLLIAPLFTFKSLAQSSSDLHVNPIENLSPDFIMGADVSMLRQIEDSGGKFFQDGVEKDALTILKEHGVNWIRLRIWNDPTDQDGNPLGGGNNDLETTVALASRAKSLGLKFLLDFHYSDWWADPSKQDMPKAWEGLTGEELSKAVYDYTVNVLQTLADADAMPDMVQVGNEVNGGMIWPAGKTWAAGDEVIGGYDGFADLLKMGIQAVRDTDPNNDDPAKRIRIIIHLADGGDNELYRNVFDELTERSVDFDIIGLSYYPYWHGTLEELQSNMDDISQRYGKDVVIAETAYAVTVKDKDGLGNRFGEREQKLGGYRASILGQATAMRDLMATVAAVPDGRGLGIFYWEPDWIAVDGAGWKTGEGNAWENQAMFGFTGAALPSLNVFNLVRPESGLDAIEATIVDPYPAEVEVTLGDTPTLPDTVKALFSDDSIRDVPVTWESPDPSVFAQSGDVTVNGIVNETDLKTTATVTVSKYRNYLANPGFEDSVLIPWSIDGDVAATDLSKEASNVHAGIFALHYWLDGEFAFTISQTVTDLPDGTYTLSAWIHGGGGENTLQLFVSDYGGDTLTADVTNTGWLLWNTPTIPTFTITGGQATVGVKIASPGGSWAFLDDLSLVKVD
jgi:arabinogalactan endo-1,4-beta-galactosidase